MRVWFLVSAAAVALAADAPFSHKQHAEVALACTFCHKTATVSERAGFPAWKTCATCHNSKAEQSIPSRRVYRLPDFVFFSHGRHSSAKIECATCHGDLKTQGEVTMFRSTKMIACVDCHKARKATVVCNACHELGQ